MVTMVQELVFELRGEDVEIALALAGDGGVDTLSYRSGDQGRENPKDLLLDKIVIAPEDPAPRVITDVEARYEEITDFEYDRVTILPDGPSITVEEVS